MLKNSPSLKVFSNSRERNVIFAVQSMHLFSQKIWNLRASCSKGYTVIDLIFVLESTQSQYFDCSSTRL